jgi:peroxiredoxin
LPWLALDSTSGRVDLRELGRELLVLFLYPHVTGSREPPVPDWDRIPGARGCTAQSCAFRDHHAELIDLRAELAGLSTQAVDEQLVFAARAGLDYRLISDPDRHVAAALGLPTFEAGGQTFYRRLTLVAANGTIEKIFYPVPAPKRNAADVVAWLAARQAQDTELR